MDSFVKFGGVNSKFANFTPLSAYSTNVFQQNSVQKCIAIMCIIVTEEDLFKKHAKKVQFFCPFSNLPQKCCPAAVQGTFKNDSKYHICPYNSNTRPGFRVHKKIWGSRTLSSTLLKIQGESKKSGISKSMYIALRAIKIKQIKF